MTSLPRLAVVGAEGRMGRFACEVTGGAYELVARIGREDDLAHELRASRAQLALDVTVAGLGYEHGRTMLSCGVRPLIGTSGVEESEVRELDGLARELDLGGLVVANFSLGMWVLQRLALDAARYFSACEIIEEHHADKRDAPSGTALDTARRLRATGAGEVPIHAVRLPGLHATQTVQFGGTGEVLRLRHEALGVEAYERGLLAALAYVRGATGVTSGLDVVFGPSDA